MNNCVDKEKFENYLEKLNTKMNKTNLKKIIDKANLILHDGHYQDLNNLMQELKDKNKS